MAAPQSMHFLNIPDHIRRDPLRFAEGEVEHYLKVLCAGDRSLRPSEEEMNAEKGASAEALKCFLQLEVTCPDDGRFTGTREAFSYFVRGIGRGETANYEIVRRDYEDLYHSCFKGFTRGLYFIDQQLLVRRNGLRANPDRPGTTREKINVLISAILWIDHLDRSPGKRGWKFMFLSFDQGRLQQYFHLLSNSPILIFLLGGQDNSAEMEEEVDRLWNWFDTHPQRPIKLGFAMARHGILWDLRTHRRIQGLNGIIDELREIHIMAF